MNGTHELVPILSSAEHDLLASHMGKSKVGLEFGMGGSTLMAARGGIESYYSVESDPEWVRHCSTHPEIAPLVAAGRWRLHHADIGPTKDAGFPLDDSAIARWPRYHTDIWSHMSDDPDLVFVDGRFRVACALQAAARCDIGTTIVIHDYVDRPFYHCLSEFFEATDTVDTMQVFELSRRPAIGRLAVVLSEHFLVPW
jgi:hypothetical protein